MKVQTYVETCQPGESPRLGGAEAPPFDKGGFGLCIHYLRSNDTGRVRERTICRKPPCEIVSGYYPQRLPCQRELARRSRD